MMKAAKLLDMNVKKHYLDAFTAFERTVTGTDKPFIRRLRNTAIAHFDSMAWPNSKDEEWRFTPLQPFLQHSFSLGENCELKPAKGGTVTIPDAIQLVFVNGYLSKPLSIIPQLPKDALLLSLKEALLNHASLVEEYLGRSIALDKCLFGSLQTAFLNDGFFLHLPRGVQIEQPIHLRFIETGSGTMNFPRILVVAHANSQVTLVESFETVGSGIHLTVPVSEYFLDEHALINHVRLNDVDASSFHFLTQQTTLKRSANFSSSAMTLGGNLVRSDISAAMNGEHAECTLNGLYTVDGERLVDNHTFIDHIQPNCPSHEIYKGILSGHGKGIFNGKIYVHQAAQKTDAKQTNQTLLLSPDATINTKPQLEIFADDVKCTHGATVGYLDQEPLFYLRSRGIPLAEAEAILSFAFANDIVQRIPVEAVRQFLERRFARN